MTERETEEEMREEEEEEDEEVKQIDLSAFSSTIKAMSFSGLKNVKRLSFALSALCALFFKSFSEQKRERE